MPRFCNAFQDYAGQLDERARLGGFLLLLDLSDLTELARRFEACHDEQMPDEHFDDLLRLTRAVLEHEHTAAGGAEDLLRWMLRMTDCVSLVRLVRLGYLQGELHAMTLSEDALPDLTATDKAHQTVGAPRGPGDSSIH